MPDTDRDDADTGYGATTRRALIAGVGVAAAGASGLFVGSAAADPQGEFPDPSQDALLKIRADRVRWVGRTSDPSSPDDGTTWYRSDV